MTANDKYRIPVVESGITSYDIVNLNTYLDEVVNHVGSASIHFSMSSISISAAQSGADYLHGIESMGSLTFSAAAHILFATAGTNKYWYKGTAKSFSASHVISCDLDDTTYRDHASASLTAGLTYFFYFKDATGNLYWSTTAWDLTDKVPVATVFWNGSAGATIIETHGHRRDLQWHINAHLTIGARINPNDFALTAPNSGSPSTVNIAGGTIYDEDNQRVFTAQTNCRVWYQTGASTYTFVDSNSIYPTNVSFADSANSYTLTNLNAAQFINIWLYVAPDIERGIYAFTETKATAGYLTVAQARAANPPTLSSFGLTNEMKLLYRVIMKGDDSFVETTDYRGSGSLPAGGVGAITAAGVTFNPSGNVASTTVQAAIEEVDSEKLPSLITKSLTADATYSGITAGFISGETQSYGEVVYIASSGQTFLADANAAGKYPAMGMAVQGVTSSISVTTMMLGMVRNDGWNFTPGGLCYLGTVAGSIVQSQPAQTDDVIQVVGVATHADMIFFNPSLNYITHT